MEVYNSYEDMISKLIKNGWSLEKTQRGITLKLHPQKGDGNFLVWGDASKASFVDINVKFSETNIMLNSSDIVGVQITFIYDIDMECVKDEKDFERVDFGTFFYVNNVCIPWVKKYPANSRVQALTLFVCDDFLKENDIHLSAEDWNKFARSINSRNTSIPQLATVLQQIRHTEIDETLFPAYFKAKAIEAFLLLLNYSKSQEENLSRINKKSRTAVIEALRILSKHYVSPPIISELAETVGIDKKTLQFAFKEIVGLSIHKYIRSLKMQKALKLLKNRTISIEKISQQVGYSSKVHFYKAFNEVFNMKPAEMRTLINK